jgi:hypothetical protein
MGLATISLSSIPEVLRPFVNNVLDRLDGHAARLYRGRGVETGLLCH